MLKVRVGWEAMRTTLTEDGAEALERRIRGTGPGWVGVAIGAALLAAGAFQDTGLAPVAGGAILLGMGILAIAIHGCRVPLARAVMKLTTTENESDSE